MEPRVYTAQELLEMRQTSSQRGLSDQLYNRLRGNGALSDIVRKRPDRTLALIRDDNAAPRASLQIRIPSKRTATRQLDGTESDWKYRGRSDSENAEPQPISAPSGLAAQKDEGFQRFYKAVVSPTHVRVTAGGRIVPNTRSATSPNGRWSQEKIPGEAAPNARPLSQDTPVHPGFPVAHAPFGSFAQGFPGYGPGMPSAMHPAHMPFPMMPWSMGMPFGHYGVAPPNPNHFQDHSSPGRADDMAKKNNPKDGGLSDASAQIRISPPENFDYSRPFFCNGQWMMAPPNQPFYPMGMAHMPSMPAPTSFNAAPAMMTPPVFPGAVDPSKEPQHNQQARKFAPSNLNAQMVAPPVAAKPPISSIRPSEITKKQIEGLRGSLRYHEDQLQYNKHQIDEKAFEQQAKLIREQIQQFEENLESQTASEASQYPGEQSKPALRSSASSQDVARSKSSTEGVSQFKSEVIDGFSQNDHRKERDTRSKHVKERELTRLPSGINSTRGVSAFALARASGESDDHQNHARRPAALPSNAALAPPFRPRRDAAISSQSDPESTDSHFASFETGTTSERNSANDSATSHAPNNKGSLANSPYLKGRLPRGVDPTDARDIDYLYARELTEDELRARHMYWGNTPRHLQKGLPKFDGKDFYPPSPVKKAQQHSSGDSTRTSARIPGYETSRTNDVGQGRVGVDPFRSLPRIGQRPPRSGLKDSTKSESLQATATTSALAPSTARRLMQGGRGFDNLRKAISDTAQASSSSSRGKSSSDEGDDDKDIIFKGRRAMTRASNAAPTKTRNDIWESMLKKGKSSANAIPSTVSSTTAQGDLPKYSGHATASLAPGKVNAGITPQIAQVKPNDDHTHLASPASVAEKKGENRHPADELLAESIENLPAHAAKHQNFATR